MASPGLGQFQPLKLSSPLSHIIWKGFRVCYVHKVWAGGHENVKHFCRLKREEIKSTEFKLQLPSDLAETIFWKDKSMQRFLNLVFEQNVLEASVVEKMSLKIAKGKKKKKARGGLRAWGKIFCGVMKTKLKFSVVIQSILFGRNHLITHPAPSLLWSGVAASCSEKRKEANGAEKADFGVQPDLVLETFHCRTWMWTPNNITKLCGASPKSWPYCHLKSVTSRQLCWPCKTVPAPTSSKQL